MSWHRLLIKGGRILKNTLETTNEATELSKTALAIKYFTVVLLLEVIVAVPLWYVFALDFFKMLGVSLALATLCLLAILDGGWFGDTPEMMVLGLIVAVPVWLVFDTGFLTVLAVSVGWGLLYPFLKGEEFREARRRRQQQARLQETEHERRKREQEERSSRPGRQDGGDGGHIVPTSPHELRALQEKRRQQARLKKRRQQARLKEPEQERRNYRPGHQDGDNKGRTVPLRPHELRAMPYKEYLQTPHWKRTRENKLRAVGRSCQLCDSSSGTIDVHHRTYKRRGEELDEDLTVLCRECHSWHHEKRRFGR